MVGNSELQIENRKLQFPYIFQVIVFALLVSTWAVADGSAPPTKERPLDRTPYDTVILKEAGGGKTLEVLPLTLRQRPLAAIPAEGSLTVRLLERPTEEFEVSWSDVAQVRIYEQVLLDEAQRHVAARKFDEAYDYFARLRREFPKMPGLDDAVCDYLRLNAMVLYQAKQHDRSLALLLTLHQLNPKYAGMAGAVETVCSEVIERYLREGNYAAGRRVLELWRNQFPDLATEASAEWQRRFEAAANRKVDEATQLIAQKNFVGARTAINRALAIWPDLKSATAISAQIEREFSFVTVGVLEAAPRQPTRRIDDWAALRTSRLTQRQLVEEVDFGSEGGDYRSPYGELALDESGLELTLKLSPIATSQSQPSGQITPDSLARYLLQMAVPGSPHFRPDYASLLSGVSLASENSVVLHFSRVHVRPEAMLQIPPPSSGNTPNASVGPDTYSIADYDSNQVVFTASNRTPGARSGPQAIVEQSMADDGEAVAALLAGDIDVLDRLPPWKIGPLRNVEGIRVDSYRLPTVHVLVPNFERPLIAKREFRRALCFGIDRKWIVERVLLGGGSMQGFEVLSGPFPAGLSLSDPIRYAYNYQIAPRPFEPRLAAILATVAWAGVQNPTGKKDAPDPGELPELTLAHANDPVIRIACQSIQAQLSRLGIKLQLREFTSEELLAGRVDCDLRYAELAMWEPLTDARLVIGQGGLSGDLQNPYLESSFRNLEAATNWTDVRARLAELHETASHELPVIPLWQTVNFFAYRSSMSGIGESPMTLYENIDQWSQSSDSNVASATPNQ